MRFGPDSTQYIPDFNDSALKSTGERSPVSMFVYLCSTADVEKIYSLNSYQTMWSWQYSGQNFKLFSWKTEWSDLNYFLLVCSAMHFPV